MRAVVIAKHGGLDVLQVQERPEPSPGHGAVRIDVRAAGVNFADTLARVGLYADAPSQAGGGSELYYDNIRVYANKK